MRNQRLRLHGRKPLKSLVREIGQFRQIVCFQGLDDVFGSLLSAWRRLRLPGRREEAHDGLSDSLWRRFWKL
jgi:hypothetical protein